MMMVVVVVVVVVVMMMIIIFIFITLKLLPCLLSQVQKVVTFNTCSIIRKFLNDEVHLSDEMASNPYYFTMYPALQLYTLISVFPDATPSRHLVQSPFSGSLTTLGMA
jgi:F0F1-type ATP synthase membrane subunit a